MKVVTMVLAAALLVTGASALTPRVAAEETVEVWKSPNCGCCALWVDHLRANGFEVVAHDVVDLGAIKRMAEVPGHLHACHTARIGDYVIEGHVPATSIERLLRDLPDVAGLAVPGMPAGSPGMPSATPERYHVMTFGENGSEVFATFVGPDEE